MDFVAFDLETTGIRADQSDIVEIGAVKFIDGHPHDPFGTLVNPGRPIPADATQVNGITDDMVRGQPPVENILTDLADYCGDLPLVAHNARFDYSFLKAAIVKHQAKAPGGVVLDSFRHFGLVAGRFHRATEDALYCGRVFLQILEYLERGGHPAGVHDLLELCGKKPMQFPVFRPAPQQLGLF